MKSEGLWREELKHPDWYLRLEDFLSKEIFPIIHDDPQLHIQRNVFYTVVDDMLKNGQIPLAEHGPDLDKRRKSIDTIIIHHTSENPTISLDRLSAIGLIRQYAKAYIDTHELRGQPIWSGHFRDKKMIFFAYHWLIRPDGTAERLLEDTYIGWHAKDMNDRSIGIAFSGDYDHIIPPEKQIEAAAEIIQHNYSLIKENRIFGHLEVMKDRTCPGTTFIPEWKKILLKMIVNVYSKT